MLRAASRDIGTSSLADRYSSKVGNLTCRDGIVVWLRTCTLSLWMKTQGEVKAGFVVSCCVFVKIAVEVWRMT